MGLFIYIVPYRKTGPKTFTIAILLIQQIDNPTKPAKLLDQLAGYSLLQANLY
jgi:hypothetical protein